MRKEDISEMHSLSIASSLISKEDDGHCIAAIPVTSSQVNASCAGSWRVAARCDGIRPVDRTLPSRVVLSTGYTEVEKRI